MVALSYNTYKYVKREEEGGELSVCRNEKMSVGKRKVEWSRMEGCCEIPENGKGS